MSDSWVVQNLNNALNTWNEKLAEVWELLLMSPQSFKGGGIWKVILQINGAVQAIGLALLVLFFLVGVVKTIASLTEIKRPEHALKLFLSFCIAKGVVTYGLELMLALFTIAQGVMTTMMKASGVAKIGKATMPDKMVKAIEDCGFFESIPLWAVTLIGSPFITVLSFIIILTVYGRFFIRSKIRPAFASRRQRVARPIRTTRMPRDTGLRMAKKQFQIQRQTQIAARISRKAAAKALQSIKMLLESTKLLITSLAAGGSVAIVIILIFVLFGAAFYTFGDDSSDNYIEVSPEVEAYTPLISKYAQQYGIGEYVELIKAVMMQESGGRGSDPMQCSESPYNKKYPKKPNGIKDPEYSINCGVHYLADCLKQSKCKSPIDMNRIRLALQGYNYGNGYISWAIKRDGGYTVANAIAFSDMQAEKHGWESYGDKQYPAHVLRYYPYGSYNIGVGNTAIVQVATKELGNHGGKKFWSWYGYDSRVAWCGCFVSWCENKCGYIKSGTVPKFSYVPDIVSWAKKHHHWQNRNYKPSPGDIIIIDWYANGTSDHVGLVERCDGRTVYTIEGNRSDAVKRGTYRVGSGLIYGFVVPKY